MWNELELLAEIDAYYDNISEEQFQKDLIAAGCVEFVEDITNILTNITYSENIGTIKMSASNTLKVGKQYKDIATIFYSDRIVNKTQFNHPYTGDLNNLSIGA
ncbi:hypothetical protein [Sporosarcina koreensis]|uniref:Phage gp6-like head-tail connector protein n=1 Tax=Sporosarcina koreensis TaxID=334735 RepID=A0ABW0U3J6_9BACL